MQELPHTRSCFVCGESNPAGLRLRFHTNGHLVRAEFTPRPEHIGFRDVVHGGIIATILDELMVWACAVQVRKFGYCADMSVRYQQPLRPEQAVVATGEMVANRRNRIFEAKAEDFRAAAHRVHRSAATPSHVSLPVVEPVHR